MDDVAIVILAHNDPVHLRRLLRALGDIQVFLHVDARTTNPVFTNMTASLGTNVTIVPRLRTHVTSWSLVEAELVALRVAVASSSAPQIVVASGADYPLCSPADLVDELRPWRHTTRMQNAPLPFEIWNSPLHPDGGLWRLRHRFLTVRGRIVRVGPVPVRWPLPRRVPPELELRSGSQWKVYARHHVERLLRVRDSRPDLVDFWRTTFVPDESFVATTLASPELAHGEDVLTPQAHGIWFMSWDRDDPNHPQTLGVTDQRNLIEAAGPDDIRTSLPADLPKCLFARKFTSLDPVILDRIDDTLLRL